MTRTTVVALGDSITLGVPGGGISYPFVLGGLLGPPWRVDNQGVAGDVAANLWMRAQADILNQAGLPHTVVVLGGINDIQLQTELWAVENNLLAIYQGAHAVGIRVVAVTVLPAGRAIVGNCWPAGSQDRLDAVNAWIRSKPDGVDVVVDAYAGMGDIAGQHPESLYPLYDSGDGVHPSPMGYLALGEIVYFGVQAGRSI